MRQVLHQNHKYKITSKIDAMALIVGIVQPLATIPQIWLIYSSHSSAGLSLFMWACYDLSSVVLLIYGLKHKLTPIIVAQTLWLMAQTPIVASIFIFA